MHANNCACCGKSFVPRYRQHQKYCSDRCRRTMQERNRRERNRGVKEDKPTQLEDMTNWVKEQEELVA